jgi:Tfp pilus assembly protein PilF
LTKNLELDEGTFKADRLSSTQADAIRADFLAYNGREKDARMLLDQVLHEDPNNTLAHETMGYLAFRDGHIDQAQDWYRQAVKLNSQSYLANYYFAEMAMDGAASGAEIDAQIENSLKNAIKLNPAFAPAYDRLAAFYASRDEKLEDAHMLSLSAIQLEPGNMGYRINAAHVLLMSHKESDAINVLQTALKLAKTPDDVMTVQNDLETVLQQQSARTRAAEAEANYQQAATRGAFTPYEPEADAKEEPLTGPHKAIIGKLKNVRCAAPATLDFDVEGGGKKLALHAHNLYKVAFTALNFQPTGELQPCIDLEGMTARVEYIESASSNGILTVQLRK